MTIIYGQSWSVNGSKNGIKDDNISVTSDNIEQMKSSSSINTNGINVNDINPKKSSSIVEYENKGASTSKTVNSGNIINNDNVTYLQGESYEIIEKQYPNDDSSDKSQTDKSDGEVATESKNNSEMSTQTETPTPTPISTKANGIVWEAEKIDDDNTGFFDKAKNWLEKIGIIKSDDKNNYIKTNYQSEYTYNRVSLNIMPLTYKTNSYVNRDVATNRIEYILGTEATGILRSKFEKTNGIIFPYTPDINMSYNVEYENSSILHSNLAINMYKNTPPSTVELIADFTADNEENAEYMYAVIIFLRALSKTDFGLKAKERGFPGMPPPVLYLNGWGNLCSNIPVVISNFGTKFDKDSQYVYVEKYDVWLPIKMTFNITLPIQPNLEKYKNQFDLNAYKNNTLHNQNNVTERSNYEVIFGKQTYVDTYDNNTTKERIVTRHKVKTSKEEIQYGGAGWTW